MANTLTLSTLPDVVLSEIFLWAIILADGRLKESEAPINLSWTCRALRAFALSQGRFWAHINLQSSCYERGPLIWSCARRERTSPLIWSSVWLERSGNALLDIVIAEDELRCGRGRRRRIEFFGRLILTHSRWKRLRVTDARTGSNIDPRKEVNWSVRDLSQLRELEAEYFEVHPNKLPDYILINGFLQLPRITKSERPIAPRLVHLHITFAVTKTNESGFLAMLEHCPALECIHSGIFDGHVWPLRGSAKDVGTVGTGTCRLSRLSRIGIGCHGAFAWLAKLDLEHGHAPALETLEVYKADVGTLANALVSFRVGPPLRRASLSFSRVRHSESAKMDKIYQALANLTHLQLGFENFEGYENSALTALSFEASGNRRFPELEYLKLVVCPEVDTTQLESMLASRMLHSRQFKAEVETSSWTVQRSKKFLARVKIRTWVRSGRLVVSGVKNGPPGPSTWERPPLAALPPGWAESRGLDLSDLLLEGPTLSY